MMNLEQKVRELIAINAKHGRKGTVLGRETWADVIKHLKEELREFEEATESKLAPAMLEEIADMLGIVVHAAIKAGFTMAQVERQELAKLAERFPPSRPGGPLIEGVIYAPSIRPKYLGEWEDGDLSQGITETPGTCQKFNCQRWDADTPIAPVLVVEKGFRVCSACKASYGRAH